MTERVLDELANSLCIPAADIKPQDKLVDICDSMELAQLMLDLELEFSLEIPTTEAQRLFTIQDVIDYVHTHCAA